MLKLIICKGYQVILSSTPHSYYHHHTLQRTAHGVCALQSSSYGSIGVFQGDLSPLSCSVLETCDASAVVRMCENWILTDGLMEKLEKFQAELAKRILKWPKHFSNTAAITALELATMRCRVLERKLVSETSCGR